VLPCPRGMTFPPCRLLRIVLWSEREFPPYVPCKSKWTRLSLLAKSESRADVARSEVKDNRKRKICPPPQACPRQGRPPKSAASARIRTALNAHPSNPLYIIVTMVKQPQVIRYTTRTKTILLTTQVHPYGSCKPNSGSDGRGRSRGTRGPIVRDKRGGTRTPDRASASRTVFGRGIPVASACGFAKVSRLNADFKKVYGCSLRDCRRDRRGALSPAPELTGDRRRLASGATTRHATKPKKP